MDADVAPGWTQEEAINVCRLIEVICPNFGCHIALTGGTLYKSGARKDLDLLFYRIRQTPQIDIDGLFQALRFLGFDDFRYHGWVVKATYDNRGVDLFFPEWKDKPKAPSGAGYGP